MVGDRLMKRRKIVRSGPVESNSCKTRSDPEEEMLDNGTMTEWEGLYAVQMRRVPERRQFRDDRVRRRFARVFGLLERS